MSKDSQTQEEWLIEYIASAFAGVTLQAGIDIHAAESLDSYGDPDEDQLSLTAERTDWRRVSPEVLFPRHCAVTFLDPQGFRFYAPAIMTTILKHGDHDRLLLDSFLFNLQVSTKGQIKQVGFSELFNKHQRAAMIRFLKYLVHHGDDWHEDSDASRRLKEIQERTAH